MSVVSCPTHACSDGMTRWLLYALLQLVGIYKRQRGKGKGVAQRGVFSGAFRNNSLCPVSGRTLQAHRPLPAACSVQEAASSVREVVSLLLWTWHRVATVHVYCCWALHASTWHKYTMLVFDTLSVVPAFAVAAPFALLFPSCADFRGRDGAAT